MTDSHAGDHAAPAAPLCEQIGVVVIGRNEGNRLERCLASITPWANRIVYVDSASTDGSAERARKHVQIVVELKDELRLTAALGRATGTKALLQKWPYTPFIFFVDGDCVVDPTWPATALDAITEQSDLAVVCGRRRESDRGFSTYNRLIDLEWDTPVGEAMACGGDALMRTEAIIALGGFDPSVLAGEEPELCSRLRQAGWRINRIDAEMTRHDAAIANFGQWWRREIRSGYGSLDVYRRTGAGPTSPFAPMVRRVWRWTVWFPLAGLILCVIAVVLGRPIHMLTTLAVFVLLHLAAMARTAWRLRRRGLSVNDALVGGSTAVLSKWAQAIGHWRRWREGARLSGHVSAHKRPAVARANATGADM